MDEIRTRVTAEHGDGCIGALDLWEANVGLVDDDMVDLLRSVRTSTTVALLSNGTTRLRRDLHVLDLLDEFDVIFNTAEIGYAKPDPEIFLHVLDALEVTPIQAVFIDDLDDNVDGAEQVGITAHRHVHREGTATFLRSRGLAIPGARASERPQRARPSRIASAGSIAGAKVLEPRHAVLETSRAIATEPHGTVNLDGVAHAGVEHPPGRLGNRLDPAIAGQAGLVVVEQEPGELDRRRQLWSRITKFERRVERGSHRFGRRSIDPADRQLVHEQVEEARRHVRRHRSPGAVSVTQCDHRRPPTRSGGLAAVVVERGGEVEVAVR